MPTTAAACPEEERRTWNPNVRKAAVFEERISAGGRVLSKCATADSSREALYTDGVGIGFMRIDREGRIGGWTYKRGTPLAPATGSTWLRTEDGKAWDAPRVRFY